MKLSECVEILARRLNVNRGRTAAIANRLQHAGLVQMAEAKKTPPELAPDEMVALLLAVLAETGVATAAAHAADYAAMTSLDGYRLRETLLAVIRGQVQPGDIIVREGGVSANVNGAHVVFGHPAEDGTARFAAGTTLSAIVAELQGATPGAADAVAAITRIHNGYH
ncbi:hypothetical protein [Mesorhizobium sp. A623]